MTELTRQTALAFPDDAGERQITAAQLERLGWQEEEILRDALDAAWRLNPDLQVNTEYDLRTGDFIIRWRTRRTTT